MKKLGVLLVNLGTPDSLDSEAVGRFLKEFLMDPDVIDIPAPVRWFLVNVLIVPRRKHASLENYKKIWTERGSPLKYYLEDLSRGVAAQLDSGKFEMKHAMRYGNPSLRLAFQGWKDQSPEKIYVVPLYPQFAESSWGSTRLEVERVADEFGLKGILTFDPPFYGDEGFLGAQAALVDEVLKNKPWDHLVMSFHGIPERQILKADSSGQTCSATNKACCEKFDPVKHAHCYRAQSLETARGLARVLGLKSDQWSIAFQSRLGRTKWIEPHTDVHLENLVRAGKKRLVVVCPSFVADCLETLEEIGVRARERHLELGGESLELVPCVNADSRWVTVLSDRVKRFSNGPT